MGSSIFGPRHTWEMHEPAHQLAANERLDLCLKVNVEVNACGVRAGEGDWLAQGPEGWQASRNGAGHAPVPWSHLHFHQPLLLKSPTVLAAHPCNATKLCGAIIRVELAFE